MFQNSIFVLNRSVCFKIWLVNVFSLSELINYLFSTNDAIDSMYKRPFIKTCYTDNKGYWVTEDVFER